MWLLVPPRVNWLGLRALAHHEADAAVATELGRALVDAGVPDGPARFYEREFAAGKALVVVLPAGGANASAMLRRHGGRDLEQIGGELARAPELEVAPPDGSAPAGRSLPWRDVAGRYQMLFDQRYGVGNATWAEWEPAYQFAWELAHEPQYRGRQWSKVASGVRRAWRERGTGLDWEQVADGMGDVWQDVADDVAVCPPDRAPAA